MRTHRTETAGEIFLSVPPEDMDRVVEAINGLLALTGHSVRAVNEEGEALYSVEEVFPENRPGMVLRGLRLKEELTQGELAARTGFRQNHISEMESGKRPITPESAKKYAEVFRVPYQMLL